VIPFLTLEETELKEQHSDLSIQRVLKIMSKWLSEDPSEDKGT
jgi:hypothetical protein